MLPAFIGSCSGKSVLPFVAGTRLKKMILTVLKFMDSTTLLKSVQTVLGCAGSTIPRALTLMVLSRKKGTIKHEHS